MKKLIYKDVINESKESIVVSINNVDEFFDKLDINDLLNGKLSRKQLNDLSQNYPQNLAKYLYKCYAKKPSLYPDLIKLFPGIGFMKGRSSKVGE